MATGILYLVKFFFKSKEEIKTFSDKQKLKVLSVDLPCKKMLKDIFFSLRRKIIVVRNLDQHIVRKSIKEIIKVKLKTFIFFFLISQKFAQNKATIYLLMYNCLMHIYIYAFVCLYINAMSDSNETRDGGRNRMILLV